jgi:signal transduction histidine kinase
MVAQRTAELKRSTDRMAINERMAAVGTLAAGLAHDMKNALLPLSSRLDTVMTDPGLSSEARTDMTVVVALIDHLREMARNLSLFARDPEQEGTEGHTDLGAWCARVKGFIEASTRGGVGAPGEWIRMKWNIPTNLPPVAVAPHRLTQAMLNLAQNARDAIVAARGSIDTGAPRTGSIVIEASPAPDDDAVRLSVIDDGCGMDEETLRRCTEPFFTTKDRPQAVGMGGSGLGLALAHAIAERSGGRLDVESQAGKGTRISLVLKVAPAARR